MRTPPHGKSTLALALAAAIASGQPLLGRRTVRRPVVYMDRENPVAIINERLARLGIPRDLQESGWLRIWGTWWQDHYPLGPDAAAIIAHARRVEPFFVWDSLVGFANCDENSSFEMRRHTSHYRHLASLEATNLILHNRSEKSQSPYRGSTDIKANMDATWEIKRDDETTAADALGRMRLTPRAWPAEELPTMKNFVMPGDYGIPVLTPNAVVSGQLVIIGAIVGVAATDAAAGAAVSLAVEGIYDLAKNPPDVLAAGGIAYFNASGLITSTAGPNDSIGWIVAPAAAGSTTARVRLVPGMPGSPTLAEASTHPKHEHEPGKRVHA